MARYREGNGNDAVINGVFYAAGLIVLCLMAWGVWRVWDDLTSPVWTLRKDQWTCTDSRTRQFSVIDGKYGHSRTTTITSCHRYSRKDG